VISFKELLEKRPWNEGWKDWKPYEKIKRNFDLNLIG
jgi:hypothetical protein